MATAKKSVGSVKAAAAAKKMSTKELLAELGAEGGKILPEHITIVGRDTETESHELMDDRAFNEPDADIAEEIAENGVRLPVLLKHCVIDGKNVLACVDGRQRTINTRAANEYRAKKGVDPLMVPFIVTKAEGASLGLETAILNEHRIADNPISRARKAAALFAKGQSMDSIARAFRVKPSTIRDNWFKVLEMNPVIVDAVSNGEMKLNAAINLSTLTHEQQEEAYNELKAKGELTMNATENARRAFKGVGASEGEGGESSGKAEKTYKPFSKKYMAAFVEWSNVGVSKASQKKGEKPIEAIQNLGVDPKTGQAMPAAQILSMLFRHLRGELASPKIPGWKQMVEFLETGPAEEETGEGESAEAEG